MVCGPSGVGKGTIIQSLLIKYPSKISLSVSDTTRLPRKREINGIHYNFISKDEFKAGINKGNYIEYAQTHTNYYGTNKLNIENISNNNQLCILEIDIKGAINIKNSNLLCKYIFITCPGEYNELERRLKGRGTENDEQINTRLKTAKFEFDFLNDIKNDGFFDGILTNDNLDECIQDTINLLKEWYPGLEF